MITRESRILSGKGRFVDDLELPNMAHCIFVGSPHGHARIRKMNVDEAAKRPGVLRILTGEDLVKHTAPLPMTSDFNRPGWHWRAPTVYS